MDLPIEIVEHVKTQYPNFSLTRFGNGLTESTFLLSNREERFVLKLFEPNISLNKLFKELWIAHYASEQNIGPNLQEFNIPLNFILMEHIDSNNLKIDIKRAVKKIKKLHQSLSYEPFTTIYTRASKIKNNAVLEEAIELLKSIEARMKKENYLIGLCHLDLHEGNVISSFEDTKIIDWSSSNFGHPYYDIAKLTFSYDESFALSIFREYLERKPQTTEKEHFLIMRTIVNLAISTNRFLKKDLMNAEKYLSHFMEKIKDFLHHQKNNLPNSSLKQPQL